MTNVQQIFKFVILVEYVFIHKDNTLNMHDLYFYTVFSNPTFHVCDSFGRYLGLELPKTKFIMTHEMTHRVSYG